MYSNSPLPLEPRRAATCKPARLSSPSRPVLWSDGLSPALDPSLATAANEFADLYHPAVRALIGSIVGDAAAANALTQKFFLEVVAQEELHRRPDRTQPQFREYLQDAVRNFLSGERPHRARRRQTSSVRSGDDPLARWDGIIQPGRAAQARAFLHGWAQGIVQTALRRVSERFRQKGRQQHFRLFVGRFLAPGEEMPTWRALGEPLALDAKAARLRAEVTARHVRMAVRELIGGEGGSAESVDDQIRALVALL